MTENERIIVVGGGIGGFVAALALLQRGFSVELLEQAPALGEVGAGVQNSPNAVHVLHALGLADEIAKVSFVPRTREIRLWDTGEGAKQPASAEDMIANFGYPHINMHRADLHAILVTAVEREERATIRLGATCVGFEQDEKGVTAILQSGERIRGAALIGADGIHSQTRRQLFGASTPKFTGCVVWRGLIPVDRLPEEMRERSGETWVGPGAHISLYPVRRGELINFVGHVDCDDWQVESWIERGDPEEFVRDFHGWHEEIQTMIRNIDIPYKWGLFLHSTLQNWSSGRVTLLGDACHPMLPYLGQGANMAIEDGYVLARCIEAFADDIPEALRRYEQLRVPRTTRVVNESAANVSRWRLPASRDEAQTSSYIAGAWSDQMSVRNWIFSYDATTVPLTEPRRAHA